MQTSTTDVVSFKSLPRERSLKMQRMFRSTMSSSERASVSQFLNNAEKEVKEYQAEINKLKANILSLENRLDSLRNRMENCQYLLSPIYRLPPEILVNIFAYGCGAMESLHYSVLPNVVSFSMVCGRWREIVLSTPSLWSNIEFSLENWGYSLEVEEDPQILVLTRIVKMFLSRSMTSPLTLDLGLPIQTSPEIEDFLEILIQSSNRWKSLDIQAHEFNHESLQSIPNLPFLKHLVFFPAMVRQDIDFFSRSPSLSSVYLSWPALDNFHRIRLPWQQIRELQLNLRGRSISPAVLAVQACPALEIFDLRWEASRVFPMEEDFHVVAMEGDSHTMSPSIKTLRLWNTGTQDVLSIFRHFALPALSTLSVSGGHTWNMSTLADFLIRSSCKITELEIWPPFRSSDGELISFLRHFPSLEVLHLSDISQTRTVITRDLSNQFSAHRRGFNQSPFLPRLTDLTLTAWEGHFDQEALLDAVKSRWLPDEGNASESGVCCLKVFSVNLKKGNTPTEDLLSSSLDYLRDAGLKVYIHRPRIQYILPW